MGYTTEFEGCVIVTPPLNKAEVSYLTDLATTRRMRRANGPYFVRGSGEYGQGKDDDIEDYNSPDPIQPGLWCQWQPTDDGTSIAWDGNEKFYNATEWMQYLTTLLCTQPDEDTLRAMTTADMRFLDFTFDHVIEGTIEAQGEDSTDRWRIVVTENVVTEQRATITWE